MTAKADLLRHLKPILKSCLKNTAKNSLKLISNFSTLLRQEFSSVWHFSLSAFKWDRNRITAKYCIISEKIPIAKNCTQSHADIKVTLSFSDFHSLYMIERKMRIDFQ